MGSEFLRAAVKAKLEGDLRELFELGFAVEVDGLNVAVSDLEKPVALPAPAEPDPAPQRVTLRIPDAKTLPVGRMTCPVCDGKLGSRGNCKRCYMREYFKKKRAAKKA